MQKALVTEKKMEEGFAIEVGKVTGRVRSTLAEMFAGFPNGVRNSRDVQKYLGVDTSLSWQVFRLLSAEDALGASRFVPAHVSMKRVFESARGRGMSGAHVDAAESAMQDFERMVRNHAGDRASFESMLAGLMGAKNSEVMRHADMQHRKAIFKGHSYYWGLQVDTRLVTAIVVPSRQIPGTFDYGQVRVLHGLRRLRAEANMLVDRHSLTRMDRKDGNVEIDRRSLDPEAFARTGSMILPRFSSSPLPELRSEQEADGSWRTEIVGEQVGQKSRMDLTFGHVMVGAPISRSPDHKSLMVGSPPRIWLPTKQLIVNMLMHRATFPAHRIRPVLDVHGHAVQTRVGDLTDTRGRLPFPEQITYVGSADAGAHAMDIPRHLELLRTLSEAMGYGLDELDVYRLKIDYPLLDTTVGAYLEIDPG